MEWTTSENRSGEGNDGAPGAATPGQAENPAGGEASDSRTYEEEEAEYPAYEEGEAEYPVAEPVGGLQRGRAQDKQFGGWRG